jgi:hypothetical protein
MRLRQAAVLAIPAAALLGGTALAGGAALAQAQSGQSSNINRNDTRSVIAPTLPAPQAGEDTSPQRYLLDARRALAAGRTGEAQEALEHAETRLLDRARPLGAEGRPVQGPRIRQIHAILEMLGNNNRAGALASLDQLIAEGPARPGRPPGFAGPPPGPGTPGYGTPGYGAPPPGYGAPPPSYGAPPPGYGASPPGYGAAGYPPPPGRYVALTVTDHGCGMTESVRARIFDPFFTTKPIGKGTGLGLPQVLGVAQQLGGGVEVSTAPGAGTTVAVFLPLAEAMLEALPPASPAGEFAYSAGAPAGG